MLDPKLYETQPLESAIIAVGLYHRSVFLAIKGANLEADVENISSFPNDVFGDEPVQEGGPGLYYWQGRPHWRKESWDASHYAVELEYLDEVIRKATLKDLEEFGLNVLTEEKGNQQ